MDALQLELRQDRPDCNVRITTVNPFTINTGLAHEPTTRFPSLIPILEPEACARIIVDGIAADEEEVFVPRVLKYPFRAGRALPRKVQLALNDFLDCGVGYKKND
jgi:short-subunit dehydrogenase